MNDAMYGVIALAAIAIYHEKGTTKAVAFLKTNNWSTNDAFSLIESYETVLQQVKDGFLG